VLEDIKAKYVKEVEVGMSFKDGVRSFNFVGDFRKLKE